VFSGIELDELTLVGELEVGVTVTLFKKRKNKSRNPRLTKRGCYPLPTPQGKSVKYVETLASMSYARTGSPQGLDNGYKLCWVGKG